MKSTCNKRFVICSCSEFVFDPRKWPREQIDEDFLTLAMTFNALRSVVRVPNLDPKYKIAVLASKQVSLFYISALYGFFEVD